MITRWEQGRATIDALLPAKAIVAIAERVIPDMPVY